jgi:hypothetical protein
LAGWNHSNGSQIRFQKAAKFALGIKCLGVFEILEAILVISPPTDKKAAAVQGVGNQR